MHVSHTPVTDSTTFTREFVIGMFENTIVPATSAGDDARKSLSVHGALVAKNAALVAQNAAEYVQEWRTRDGAFVECVLGKPRPNSTKTQCIASHCNAVGDELAPFGDRVDVICKPHADVAARLLFPRTMIERCCALREMVDRSVRASRGSYMDDDATKDRAFDAALAIVTSDHTFQALAAMIVRFQADRTAAHDGPV